MFLKLPRVHLVCIHLAHLALRRSSLSWRARRHRGWIWLANSVWVCHPEKGIERWLDLTAAGSEYCLDDTRLNSWEGLAESGFGLLSGADWSWGLCGWYVVFRRWVGSIVGFGTSRCGGGSSFLVAVEVKWTCSCRRLGWAVGWLEG